MAAGPGAGPHRARRQGPGVADRGGAAPERAGVPVDGVDADLAHRRRRPAAAAARRPRRPGRCTAFRCSTPPTVNDRKALSDKSSTHTATGSTQRRVDEERRLLYVALTRAEDTLLLSGHHWGATEIQAARAVGVPLRDQGHHRAPRPPPASRAAWSSTGRPHPPTVSRTRCGTTSSRRCGRSTRWAARRGDVRARRARWCAAAMAGTDRRRPAVRRSDGWAADVDALLAERAARRRAAPGRRCPPQLSVSSAGRTRPRPRRRGAPADAAGCRPGRTRTPCWAPLSTTGCSGSTAPSGCSTSTTCPARSTRRRRATPRASPSCRTRSCASPWAARTPVDVEVPFEMVDRRHRGAGPHRRGVRRRRRRRDRRRLEDRRAARPTRRPAGTPRFSSRSTGWRGPALRGCPASPVRAAFHYVRSGRTVAPESLPEADELGGAARDPGPERCARS